MQRGYRGIAGSPVKPYIQFSTYINSDIWLNLTFLDRNKHLVTPTTISYRIDDLTTDTVVLTDTAVTPLGPKMSINIPASVNVIISDTGQSSQINQVAVTTTYSDGTANESVHVYELITIETVGGAGSATIA